MLSDQPVRPGEVSADNHSATKILSEQTNGDFASINNRSQITADTAAMAATSKIPDFQISGIDSAPNAGTAVPQENSFEEYLHDTATIASDVGTGITNELTQHLDDVGKAALVGVGIGLAITAAVFIAPEAAFVGALFAGGLAFTQLAVSTVNFAHDARIVSHPEIYSAAEVAQSHSDLQDFGKGATLVVAGAAGGWSVGLGGITFGALF